VYYYDGAGNLTKRVAATGAVTQYTYDALDRVLTMTFPADSAENVAYTYDQSGHGSGIGRLTSVTDAAGTLSRSYDQPHGQHPTRGSVFAEPLAGGQAPDQYSLWLEHVVSTDAPEDECYWLMWYHDGRPTIPMSSILQRDDIANMQRLFASLIP
jgi:YD repeat-containing protein